MHSNLYIQFLLPYLVISTKYVVGEPEYVPIYLCVQCNYLCSHFYYSESLPLIVMRAFQKIMKIHLFYPLKFFLILRTKKTKQN